MDTYQQFQQPDDALRGSFVFSTRKSVGWVSTMNGGFMAKGAGIARTGESTVWGCNSAALFEGMPCFCSFPGEAVAGTYFYPQPDDLRRRLASLDANPIPIVESIKKCHCQPEEKGCYVLAQIPKVLRKMHEFVDCYEKAFANKTPWRAVYQPQGSEDREQENIDDFHDIEMDCPPGLDAHDISHTEECELVGEPVEWGDPSLIKSLYVRVPFQMHREPYIILASSNRDAR